MRFVQDHHAVPALDQVPALLRIVEDQTGRDDGDLHRAIGDVFWPARADVVPVMVNPPLIRRGPDRAGDAELVEQLGLPLQGERGRAEDEGWTVAERDQRASGGRGAIWISDGWPVYRRAVRQVYRDAQPTGKRGRPPLVLTPGAGLTQAVKRRHDDARGGVSGSG